MQILDDSSKTQHRTHTNVYATGRDGAIWSTFWRDIDESHIFKPDVSFWGPGEYAKNGGFQIDGGTGGLDN